MNDQIWGGDDARPFKAKFFIPCFVSECHTERPDGTCPRSQMQLQIRRRDGVLLQRPFNEGPTYKCERVGCYFHDHPRGLHEINSEWIRDGGRWEQKRGQHEERTEHDMEVTI